MNNLLGNLGNLGSLGVSIIIHLNQIQPKVLLEFKAGKMNYDGRMVKPDRRRGVIKITEDQGMK